MLTAREIELVQTSFAVVAPDSEKVAELFYSRLFHLDPALRGLFTSDMKEQGRKLMTMLAVVVNGLAQLDRLVPAAQDLARRHAGYGVKREDYATVGESLLWTLDKGLGAAFTAETQAAWALTYDTVAGVMVGAAYPSSAA